MQESWALSPLGAERRALTRTINRSIKNLTASQGLIKTNEAIDSLEIKFRFDLANRPSALPLSNTSNDTPTTADIFEFFGISDGWAARNGTSNHRLMSALIPQWEAHCKQWRAPTAGADRATPLDTYDYWESLADDAKELSAIALYHWSAPISNAMPERVFRVVTHMDDPLRRSMEHLTFENTIDLRVNRSYLEDMADELVADIAHTKGAPTPREVESGMSATGKRSRDAEAAASKGMDNLRSIKKTRKKKTRAMSDDEEDSEDAILRLREEAACG
jgi:hypothetical protein